MPTADLTIAYDGVLDKAAEIAKSDIRGCMGRNRCGCRGVPPAGKGYEEGMWLADAVWTFNDAITYFVSPQEATDYLYAETPGAMGVIPFFAGFQETAEPHAGNIPIAKYVPGTVPYEFDYGGFFDLTVNPRRNHRDEVPAGAFFVHAIYQHWKLFNTTEYIEKYFPVLEKYMAYRTRGLDAEMGLFRSVHGLGDVAVDKAVPRSTALLFVNAECMRMFSRYAEMAAAIGQRAEADKYQSLAERLRDGINQHLWNETARRYEVKIFENPTTNENSCLYNAKEDHRFFVAGNMWLVYAGVPNTRAKVAALMAEIEKADGGLKLYGQSVEPPYPDNSYSGIFNGGAYWNGDVWPCFSSCYAIVLFRLGYPAEAAKILRRQADVVIRDGGFYEFYEDNEQGTGKGAFHYGFTAAPYVRAVVEGLFGLEADYPGGRVKIHPSLQQSGGVQCQLGLHRFDVKMKIQSGSRELSVDTTYDGPASFRVLIEPAATACRATKSSGGELKCSVKKVGNSTYAFFDDELHTGTTAYRLASDGT